MPKSNLILQIIACYEVDHIFTVNCLLAGWRSRVFPKDSAYVWCEVGARWGSDKIFIPFIASKSGTSLLDGPIRNIHALNGCRSGDIYQLIIDVAHLLNIEPASPFVYSDKVEKLVQLALLN